MVQQEAVEPQLGQEQWPRGEAGAYPEAVLSHPLEADWMCMDLSQKPRLLGRALELPLVKVGWALERS